MTTTIDPLEIVFPDNFVPITIENLPIGQQTSAESCVSVTFATDVTYEANDVEINHISEGQPRIIKYQVLPWQPTVHGDLICRLVAPDGMVINKICMLVALPMPAAETLDEPGVHTVRMGGSDLFEFELTYESVCSVFDSIRLSETNFPRFVECTKTFNPGLKLTTNLQIQIPEGTYSGVSTYDIYVCGSAVGDILQSTNISTNIIPEAE